MKTAQEMYKYCKNNKFGTGIIKSWSLKHFSIIQSALSTDENVIMCFMGLHNYKSPGKHDRNFAYAVTNKRIIMAQKKLIGKNFQTIFLDNINDVTFSSSLVYGIITIDTLKEKFNVALDKSQANNINLKIHDVLYELKKEQSSTPKKNPQDTICEIKRYKELLESGIITQKEFELKKKLLLGI